MMKTMWSRPRAHTSNLNLRDQTQTFYFHDRGLYFHTFRALAECVGLHAEGGAEAFPVTEASGFGLLGGTFLDGVSVTCELLARPNRWPCIGKANTLE